MTTGPERGSEEYLVILERRIKEQRDHIESLNALRETVSNRQERKRMEKLERALGRATLKIEEQKRAIAYLRDRLAEHGEEPVRRGPPKIHVP
jgi:hypothetical protein